MKAYLLAAGEGTRLRPLTYKAPKCLVTIKGKPLLHYWFRLFEKYGVTEVLINLHHLPHLVDDFLSRNSYNLKITKFYEKNLLGTAGTVAANKKFAKNEKEFFIFYADNLTDMNLTKFLNYHRSHNNFFTMGLFRTNIPKQCGIAELNEDGLITSFEEKPKNPKTNLANAGVYVSGPEIFDILSTVEKELSSPIDFGHHILPRLVGKMYGYLIKEFFLDIGTWDNYERTQEEWEGGSL